MDVAKAKTLLQGIVAEITYFNGQAATDKFSGFRDVDAKVREAMNGLFLGCLRRSQRKWIETLIFQPIAEAFALKH